MTRRNMPWLALLWLACACNPPPEPPSASLVDRPRVLAMIAEPPEVAPGEDTLLTMLHAEFDEPPVFHWSACSAFYSTERNRQYEDMSLSQGCSGGLALDLGEGPDAVLPGEATQALFDNLDLAEEILGVDLPDATIEQLRSEVGLPLSIEAVTTYANKELRVIKRVLVSERPDGHQNPPPPRFALDDIAVAATTDDPLRCEPESESEVRLPADTKIELVPLFEGDSEPWVETYQVIDVYGELAEREEVPSYSWFTTAGKLDEDITRAPLRNQRWRTPDADMCVTLWIVVRDGHGGASGCAVSVAVGDAEDCE